MYVLPRVLKAVAANCLCFVSKFWKNHSDFVIYQLVRNLVSGLLILKPVFLCKCLFFMMIETLFSEC